MAHCVLIVLILAVALKAQVPIGATKQETIDRLGSPVRASSSIGQEVLTYPEFSVTLAGGLVESLQFKPQNVKVHLNYSESSLRTSFGYYPSFNKVQLIGDVSALDGGDKVTDASVILRRKGNSAVIAKTQLGPFRNFTAKLLWDVPALPEGEYELGITCSGTGGIEAIIPFVRHVLPWEHNALGKSDILVPPFTPIQINGNTLGTLLRNHSLGPLGLWDQIESLGRPLLNSPMRLELMSGGQMMDLTGTTLKITGESATQVTTQSDWSNGTLRLQTTGEWDYDGMMKWTLHLFPGSGPTPVDSLTLVIPLRDSAMSLFHSCTPGLRHNYAGVIPAGQNRVWDGTQVIANPIDGPSLIGNFVPYLWLGAEERGISVFGENDRGWVNAINLPCQELVRHGEVLELRLNLIAKPTIIDAPRQMRVGFEATPIKPMPPDWRKWAESYETEPTAGSRSIAFVSSGWSWGAWTPCLDIYPINEDYSLFDRYAAARKTGVIDEAYLAGWVAKYAPSFSSQYPQFDLSGLTKAVSEQVHYAAWLAHAQPQNVLLYTNARGVRFDTPEGQTFVDEWNRKAFIERNWTSPAGPAYDLNPGESYRDYAMWYYKKMLTTFADSIYWDDVFLQPDFNVVGSDAYELPDGRVQPAVGLFDMRELIRRTAVLDQELGLTGSVNQTHYTNTAIAPILAFARSGLTWEDRGGNTDYQDRFSRDYIRAESIGRQFGNPSFVLNLLSDLPDPASSAGKAKSAWIDRTFAATILVHEIRYIYPSLADSILKLLYTYGYGTTATRTYNYWEEILPITLSRDDASHLIVTKPGSAMVVVSDFGNGGDVLLSFDRSLLGLSSNIVAVDMENNLPLQLTADGRVKFALKKHDFKLVKIYDRSAATNPP